MAVQKALVDLIEQCESLGIDVAKALGVPPELIQAAKDGTAPDAPPAVIEALKKLIAEAGKAPAKQKAAPAGAPAPGAPAPAPAYPGR